MKPVVCQPAFFMLLFALLVAPDFLTEIYYLKLTPFRIPTGLISCYALSLPVLILPSILRKFYKSLVIVFASIMFVIDIYLLLLYGHTFGTLGRDAVSAVLATNPGEAQEFIDTYLTADKVLFVSTSLIAVLLLFYYIRRLHIRFCNAFKNSFVVLLTISVLVVVVFFNKVMYCNLCYLLTKECPDLREYRQNPEVICDEERVDNVVLIVGESFSKLHSSLYGYDKKTNPLLEELRDEGKLVVYDNATSACVTTIPSIKSIMMAYTDAMSDSIDWYRCLTIIEVMQKSGYRTYWLSNQPKTGFFENEVGRFADLCDEQVFIGDKHGSLSSGNKDEELIPVVEKCLADTCKQRFIVVHMVGSHFDYDKRYTDEYDRFNRADYAESHSHLSSSKRGVVAEYDNTVLYNDYVVYELMQKFTGKDAVVVYLSDHGEDVYRSSSGFRGHASGVSAAHEKIVKQIPLMFYTPELFREKHPVKQSQIDAACKTHYRTDSIMYTLMDLAGVETVNGVSYKNKSLLK
jgi:heptose-I-phosphate ethanolaminephosphotransferase